MVDALKRVRGWMASGGIVVDIHPTAAAATIIVGDETAGPIEPGGATARHQAATDALAAAVAQHLFSIDDSVAFDFSTYADSLEELNEHILEDWREARIGERTFARARVLLERARGRVRVLEQVTATRLSVIGN